jgi:two-component system response regulator AtoC
VKARQFREDLFYRLNVVPIWIPPLRDRPGDVAKLARHFCTALAAANNRRSVDLAPEALQRLAAHRWPGNVRQLQNLIERLIVLSDGPSITLSDVERELSREEAVTDPAGSSRGLSLHLRRQGAERDALQEALIRAAGNRSVAARLLGISRRTLYTKLSEHHLA